MTKSELRKLFLERRLSMPPELRQRKSDKIARRLIDHLELSGNGTVHCYLAAAERGEVSTSTIFRWIWDNRPNIVTLAPRVDLESGEIESVAYGPHTRLEFSRWNIPEPVDGKAVAPARIDMVVLPLLCFDRAGHRVGYGKGFYDRLLNKCRPDCIKAGLSFFPPADTIEDVYEGDVRLDLCVTPDRIYKFTSP